LTVSGWLFDAYPIKDRMIFWIKDENGRSIKRLEDAWTPSIYVGSDSKIEQFSTISKVMTLFQDMKALEIMSRAQYCS
jgi:hypothetical protein